MDEFLENFYILMNFQNLYEIFENIGMTLGLAPMTGVPLPFLSYGGSSMFATLIGVGLLLNIRARS